MVQHEECEEEDETEHEVNEKQLEDHSDEQDEGATDDDALLLEHI